MRLVLQYVSQLRQKLLSAGKKVGAVFHLGGIVGDADGESFFVGISARDREVYL
jgi:phosphoribosyl-AMP cyclohydrolase